MSWSMPGRRAEYTSTRTSATAPASVHGVVGLPSPLLSLGKGGRQPCLAREMQRAVVSRAKSLTVGGANLSAFDACRPMVELVLAKGAVCVWGPLSAGAYGGVPRGCGAGVAQLLF
jgi:hypothetical protein